MLDRGSTKTLTEAKTAKTYEELLTIAEAFAPTSDLLFYITFEGLKDKNFEIFPDEASLGIMYMLKNNPKQLEKDFSSSIL